MPLGQAGSLTEREAYEIARYFIQLDRPDFPGRVHDWPKGGKPSDAQYWVYGCVPATLLWSRKHCGPFGRRRQFVRAARASLRQYAVQ